MTLPPIKNISPFTLTNEDVQDYLALKQKGDANNHTNVKEETGVKESDPDILVLGFQELDLSAEALLISYTTDREEMWLGSIFAALGEAGSKYTKVNHRTLKGDFRCIEIYILRRQLVSRQLVGMLIIVLVKTDVIMHISDVRTGAVGAGFMGMMVHPPHFFYLVYVDDCCRVIKEPPPPGLRCIIRQYLRSSIRTWPHSTNSQRSATPTSTNSFAE